MKPRCALIARVIWWMSPCRCVSPWLTTFRGAPPARSSAIDCPLWREFPNDCLRTHGLARNSLHQCRYFYGRKIGEGIGYRIRQDDLVTVTHCATGVDNIGH